MEIEAQLVTTFTQQSQGQLLRSDTKGQISYLFFFFLSGISKHLLGLSILQVSIVTALTLILPCIFII